MQLLILSSTFVNKDPPLHTSALPSFRALQMLLVDTILTIGGMQSGSPFQKCKMFQVPASLSLAVKSRQGYAQDAAERAEMKRLVLEAEYRDDNSNLPSIQPLKNAGKVPKGGPQSSGIPASAGGSRQVKKLFALQKEAFRTDKKT